MNPNVTNLDDINVFSKSFYEVLKEHLRIYSRKGQLVIRKKINPINGIAILIAFSEDLIGRVMVCMSLETSQRFTERFTKNTQAETNDLYIYALKEFGNIICGNAVSKFIQKGIEIKASSPTILHGEAIEIFEESHHEMIVIPFETDVGIIDLNIILEKNN